MVIIAPGYGTSASSGWAGQVTDAVNDLVADVALVGLGAWTAYTPTLTNWTNAAAAGRWTRIGRTIHFKATITCSGTPVITNPPGITVPTAAATGGLNPSVVSAFYQDTSDSSAIYPGIVRPASGSPTTVLNLYLMADDLGAGSAYIAYAAMSASAPFAWANTDVAYIAGTYEAAA